MFGEIINTVPQILSYNFLCEIICVFCSLNVFLLVHSTKHIKEEFVILEPVGLVQFGLSFLHLPLVLLGQGYSTKTADRPVNSQTLLQQKIEVTLILKGGLFCGMSCWRNISIKLPLSL